MMPLNLPSPASAERTRLMPVDVLRQQALARLYQRRETVDNLIRSLEDYERAKSKGQAVCMDINVLRKRSSGFSQSRI